VKAANLLNVNPLLVDRIRLAIMANLALAGEPVDFNTLQVELDLTKGNLSSHISKLEDADLITVHKEFVGKKPRTTYVCTKKGKKELQVYLSAIEGLLKAAL
jgi:DNA-binding transcriptional ArsR family regulator